MKIENNLLILFSCNSEQENESFPPLKDEEFIQFLYVSKRTSHSGPKTLITNIYAQ